MRQNIAGTGHPTHSMRPTAGRWAPRWALPRRSPPIASASRASGGTNGRPPPDRYRLRLWFLRGADPSSADAVSLRMAVACAHAGEEDVSATTPDIDDGGDLIRGNQQIHPPLPNTSRCVP